MYRTFKICMYIGSMMYHLCTCPLISYMYILPFGARPDIASPVLPITVHLYTYFLRLTAIMGAEKNLFMYTQPAREAFPLTAFVSWRSPRRMTRDANTPC